MWKDLGCTDKVNEWSQWHKYSNSILSRDWNQEMYIDVYKYTLGGGGQENKYTIYILIVFYGAIFRMVFPLVS